MGKKEKTMNVEVDMSKVKPAALMKEEDEQETDELRQLLEEASKYLNSFDWCARIKESFLGIGIPKVLGVFLFKIQPAKQNVDNVVWIIVGDLPPAYITAEDAPNPASALDAYIGAMEEWVDAAKSGRSVVDLIPVNVPATLENAKRLETRLQFLDKEVLALYADDLSN